MVPIWKQRHSQRIRQMKRPFFGAVTSGQAFSVGVLEELLILIVVSLLSYKLHSPILCLASWWLIRYIFSCIFECA
nr:hypothetical protein [Lacticaseibacillus chiayiensis]